MKPLSANFITVALPRGANYFKGMWESNVSFGARNYDGTAGKWVVKQFSLGMP